MSSSTVIRTNYRSLNAHRNLAAVGSSQDKASKRLSSGYKINSAADDAAGLAISEKMKAQIRGLDMASKNAQDATSLIQTAEGSVGEIDNMVQRCRELAVQAATDTNKTTDRAKLQKEVNQLLEEIDNMANRTKFNEKTLNKEGTLTFQIGANQSEEISLTLQKIDSTALKINDLKGAGDTSGIAESRDKASAAITTFDTALDTIASYRAVLGAVQNRLEYTDSNLQTSSENLSNANSRIVDADMASEMSNLTSANVLQQAATAMLAQANSSTQTVLQLLQ